MGNYIRYITNPIFTYNLALKRIVYYLIGFTYLRLKYNPFNKINSELVEYTNLLYGYCLNI